MQTFLISFESEEEIIYKTFFKIFSPRIWVLTTQIMSCNWKALSLEVGCPSWPLTQNCNMHLSGAISELQSRFEPKTAKGIYRLLLFSFASNSWHLEVSDIHRWTRDSFDRTVLVHFSFSENTKTHNKIQKQSFLLRDQQQFSPYLDYSCICTADLVAVDPPQINLSADPK